MDNGWYYARITRCITIFIADFFYDLLLLRVSVRSIGGGHVDQGRPLGFPRNYRCVFEIFLCPPPLPSPLSRYHFPESVNVRPRVRDLPDALLPPATNGTRGKAKCRGLLSPRSSSRSPDHPSIVRRANGTGHTRAICGNGIDFCSTIFRTSPNSSLAPRSPDAGDFRLWSSTAGTDDRVQGRYHRGNIVETLQQPRG